ncbi:MAG TPA: DNA topoisomerase (ATP-hydrolyzing), partial [Methylomirabilota bacterium]|nr:DNA topoisomerase (ATP-hydrolyzing) [Methylomirabilota bacterium]
MFKAFDIDIQTLPFTPELDRAYRLYAAKTIEDRALPDVRDGCKPVQRRILYAMYDMGLRSDRPQKKCARIVGEVLGKYHPHGDQAVYGALVRMAQDFTMRGALVDGQGNFGSIDGDGAAAMRYTEARLSALGESLLSDIGADTVDFQDNFDNSLTEPLVLPAAFPNLLVNGSSGIAVGMATNIPPHNLGEIADAVQHVVLRWAARDKITVDELMEHVPGPDFPTGGIIYRYRDAGADEVVDSIKRAYETGAGRIITQARMHIEDIGGGKQNIVISELPYTVQKSTVLERIAKEAKEGRIVGLTDLRDESDYDDGLRVVAEVSRTAKAPEVMAQLLKYSQLQETFGVNAMALVPDATQGPERSGVRPQRLTLRDMLIHFVAFRLEVIERRTRHELAQREARLHIVDGLLKALDAIDEVVALIRKSKNAEAARTALMKALKLSDEQARAILEMPLRRLTSLEIGALRDEAKTLRARIAVLKGLLESESKRLALVADETRQIRDAFATPRRTVIIDTEEMAAGAQVVLESDLRMPSSPQVVVLTTNGIERRDSAGFRYAPAAGLTTRATTSQILAVRAQPTDQIIFFSSAGRAWRNQVGFVPDKATFNQLGLVRGETIVGAAVQPAAPSADDDQATAVFATRAGRIKRTALADLSLTAGIWSTVVGLPEEDDAVLVASIADSSAEVVFVTAGALVLRTAAGAVNPQASGTARGVAGIGLKGRDVPIAAAIVPADPADDLSVYVVSETGYVKRVPYSEYPPKGRGSQGVQ